MRFSVTLLLAACLIAPPAARAQRRDTYAEQREDMVREFLEQEGITSKRVLQSMRTVPRHEFVRTDMQRYAYQDAALPIGYKQTISPPFVVAYMTQTIDPQPTDKILEIGTGSGYQAAVLSGLCAEVYTIEIVDGLGKAAALRLNRLGYDNVHPTVGDGFKGWPEHAPFDKIIVTCSPERVPQPLIDQLKDGGRMIIPLGERYQQVFYLFEKNDGKLQQKRLIPTLFVPMTGISEENRQVKPDPLHPEIVNGSFELDENGDGRTDNWHYQRQTRRMEAEGGGRDGRFHQCFTNDEPGRVSQMLQGTAVDGRKIGTLQFSFFVQYAGTRAGSERYERPGLYVHFYDETRKPMADVMLGPFLGDGDWQAVRGEIKVPAAAREMIVRVGLNGATGRMCVDDISMTPVSR